MNVNSNNYRTSCQSHVIQKLITYISKKFTEIVERMFYDYVIY